jgi:kynurenine formamidase
MFRRGVWLSGLLGLLGTACAVETASDFDLSAYELVDLTHPFDGRTVYWPTATTGFELDTLAYGMTPGGWFYAANAFATPEHGGTHLDAPLHFASGQAAADEIPLERLVADAAVIDVTAQASEDPDYQLTTEDVLAFENDHGVIAEGTIVLLRTGWSRYWPDAADYLGDDTPGDASRLHFPGYGEAAARLLVEERRVGALGADVASIDIGASQDFLVHRVAAAAGVPGLENLTSLDRLPPRGAIVVALPMKIAGGSGGPLRAIALVPRGQ